MSPQEKVSMLWKRIPRKVFGGRMRTTTVAMCVLWICLAILNSELNPEPGKASTGTVPAVGTEQSHVVPEPAQKSSTDTRTSTTPPSETSSSPSSSPSPSTSVPSGSERPGGRSETPTTTPGAGGGSTTSGTSQQTTTLQPPAPQVSQEPESSPSGEATTTAPTPQG
ncbi:hypothetical protein RHDE110596_08490 [Prescottella defluvii]|uniref:hypothetical protein n=1 Tax=Prescottella defluvii TaxID=1323361 RepID=UPI0004F35B93|nr:hypothetical protein [Prescottella defluvii]